MLNVETWPHGHYTRDPIGERGGLNLYGFVGNDPIRKLDPIGLAYFAYRPLGGFLGFLGVFGGDEPADDNLNTVIGHEQLFFEDGGEPANIGFFSDTTLREEGEPELSKYREPHDTGWNDCVMRNAILLTKHSTM